MGNTRPLPLCINRRLLQSQDVSDSPRGDPVDGDFFRTDTSQLIEGMALHAFDDVSPFTREKIERLKAVYELDLTAADSHHMGGPDDGTA